MSLAADRWRAGIRHAFGMSQFMVNFVAVIAGGILKLVKPYHAWRLFHELRRRMPGRIRELLEYCLMAELPDRPVSAAFEQQYFYRTRSTATVPLCIEVTDERIRAALDEIPSETTDAERRYLYTFFKTTWSGQNDVFEVGPFLGGTTRAMAMGMHANAHRRDGPRLYTFDRFKEYHRPEDLAAMLAPFFERARLDEAQRREVAESGDFLEAFRKIHGGRPYAELIVEKDHVLPDMPDDVAALENILTLPPDQRFDAAFIDGCKSWFGTKHCMKQLAPCMPVGAYIMFQDYGWYTCFWLPAFVTMAGPAFTLIGYVDNTYVFQLARPLDAEAIDRDFPDQPNGLGPAFFEDLFVRQREAAARRSDQRAVLSLTLQMGAACAYLGEHERARDIIDAAAGEPMASGYEGMVRDARKSPTYFPAHHGGAIYLD